MIGRKEKLSGLRLLLIFALGLVFLPTTVTLGAGIKPIITAPLGTSGGSVPIRVTFTY